MSKILELAIENLAKKIEVLETEVTELKKQKGNSGYTPRREPQASTTQEASPEQMKFARDLGMLEGVTEKITKSECAVLIKEGIKRKNKNDNTTQKPEPTKTEVPKETKESKSTNEEIEELINEEEEKKDSNFDEDGAYL